MSPGELVTIFVGALLIFTGLVLHYQQEEGDRTIINLSNKELLFLGMAQGVAVLPGVSRSGMTISVLLYLSLTQAEALRGSFLISVPAVAGAIVIESLNGGLGGLSIEIILLALIVVFLTGLLSMEVLLRSSKRLPFDRFCIGLGIIAILVGVFGILLTPMLT